MRCKKVKNPIYCVYIVAYIVLTTMDFIDPFDGGGLVVVLVDIGAAALFM